MAELGVWTIPGYVVHERLEAGLVSATYLASRTSDGYPVLLQVVSEEFSDPLSAEHFRTTIERVSAIRHPVIPVVAEVGEADGLLYTIANAVEGRSLDATLRSQGTLSHDDTLAVCRELADALDMLATAGIVHAAISPTTVWINDRMRAPSAPYVSLRGFGTTPLRARRIQDPDAAPPAEVLYTAPEQIHGAAPVEQTDQYALACMVLHALTGTAPFARPTTNELFDAHLSQVTDDDVLHADSLPVDLVTALQRALAKDPVDRFPSCAAFADALGATARPSWTWMMEPGQAPSQGAREGDSRDDVTDRSDDRPAWHERRQTPNAVRGTTRSLSEVDWRPGSATPTGQQPVRTPSTPAARGPDPAASPRRRRRYLPAGVARWLGLAVLAIVTFLGVLALVRMLASDGETPRPVLGDQPNGDGVHEIAATWQEPITDGPVELLTATDDEVISVTDATVTSLDHDTGRARWTTTLDSAIEDLSVLGSTVIVHTASEFVALNRSDGSIRWRSSESGVADLKAFITGRGRMYGLSTGEGGELLALAVDPTSGETGWTLTVPSDADSDPDAPALIAFDGSERGYRSLYVAHGDQLHAFAVTTREQRWQVTMESSEPAVMTALAGAIIVVGHDGSVCSYEAKDGDTAWPACPTLERTDAPATITQISDGRVVIANEHEVLSVDLASGTPQWRIVSEDALQPAMTGNNVATYVAAADGTVEAIAQRNGASLWQSAPFGQISAMTATDDAVYLTTTDGRLTRLEAPPDDG
jgi:serine/threonine protein kinase/outer membrane protein assembly factor BamB